MQLLNASIYFDFNDPAVTNQILHRIDRRDVTTTAGAALHEQFSALKVFRNPNFTGHLFFDKVMPEGIHLELYDPLGHLVSRQLILVNVLSLGAEVPNG